MPLATVGGQTIAYETSGTDGDPILFVHGWACNKEMWRSTVDQLKHLGRCYSIDLLGHGDSSKPDPHGNGYAIENQAKAVELFIREVIGQPTRYVGHSMGGMIGLHLAYHHPELITRMALLAPAVTGKLIGFLAGYLRLLALPGGDRAFDALFQWTRSKVSNLDWFCRIAYFNDRSVLDRAVTESSYPGFRKTTSAILARMLYEIRSTDLSPILEHITTPTLIIHGREDNVVPVTDGLLAVSKMVNASIVELDGINHVADLEGRDRCWAPLRAFFTPPHAETEQSESTAQELVPAQKPEKPEKSEQILSNFTQRITNKTYPQHDTV
jgi:Predicted hydrolases or acyltransferases (alpha/beta hydrolase superfamily)